MFPGPEDQVTPQPEPFLEPEPTHTIVPNQSLTWEAADLEGFELEISGLNKENALQLFGQTAENWTVWGFEISFVNGFYYVDMIFNNSRVYAYRFNEPPTKIYISKIETDLEVGFEFPSGRTTRKEVKLSQSDIEQIHFLKATQS